MGIFPYAYQLVDWAEKHQLNEMRVKLEYSNNGYGISHISRSRIATTVGDLLMNLPLFEPVGMENSIICTKRNIT